MRRKENVDESRVHIFTSHFYTALAEGGPQSVESWTAKKNIDIFSKRMIFIPINKSLHWSLCVVVNAKEIGQMYQDRDENAPRPCILFFDALKAHKKQAVAKKVIGWLNAEWKRLGKTASSIDDPQHKTKPFDNCTMQVVAPRSKYLRSCLNDFRETLTNSFLALDAISRQFLTKIIAGIAVFLSVDTRMGCSKPATTRFTPRVILARASWLLLPTPLSSRLTWEISPVFG
jgi:Ulp1 protease family, C-terminal catalytic domain